MTVYDFLDWAEGQEGRFELIDGQPVAMAPERVEHGEAKYAAAKALEAAIAAAKAPCRVLIDSVAVRIDAYTTFQPDALVYCGERLARGAREARDPVIVVEVLSPSTMRRDMTEKVAGYFSVPSIQHYLIVDPDERLVIQHSRSTDGLHPPKLIREGEIRLAPPGLSLDAANLFPPD